MISAQTKKLLEVFISMSSEKDGNVLLETILNSALDITNCDAGTLYILKDKKLEFKFMITKSLNLKKGGNNEKINLPSVSLVKTNVCAYSVLENKAINISDVYSSELFDFSGPKEYDKLTNYKTKSMMVIPMEDDEGEIIGVLQLMNAQDEKGNIISFSKESEMILTAIASQAAIRLTNMNYTAEIKTLMESIVKTFAEVIYLRTPYNVSHTHNMEKYASKFLEWIRENPNSYISFSKEDEMMFLMSIWLHDIGKLITPLEVMDKATRLSVKIERVLTRLDIISLTTKLLAAKNNENIENVLDDIEKTRYFVCEVNKMPYLDEETIQRVKALKEKTYIDENGDELFWFTKDEIEDLSIIRGTLTPKERLIMQKHVEMTEQILNKMNFKSGYKNVPLWANSHHEFLDGTGYPKQLKGDEIDIPTRLLTIIDVFDGLSASDRPYKKPTPINRVFEIMTEMQNEGKLDKILLTLFKDSKAWETTNVKDEGIII